VKILIVDDSKAMRLIVRKTLREAGFERHEFVEQVNGKVALEALRDANYDLVLSDWNMPEMTGIELLESLRKENIRVKFGFVTSEGSDEIRARALEAGAMFLVVKPFSAESFQKLFRTHVPEAFA
jgi:two-component system chemotaxis response regulator CheY